VSKPGWGNRANAAGTNAVKATVVVEGRDGNSLSGAVVTVTDRYNSLLPLAYESSSCTYTGMLDEFEGETEYIIEVTSITFDTPVKLTVPYTSLSDSPRTTVFHDAQGNSVLNGQPLLASQPIQIGWSLCGDDVVYQAAIKTALKTPYTVTTTAGTVTIPANTLTAGAYMLEITAQKIHGDMYFRSVPYYAVSAITSPLVSCYVE
jgi:hypothetical protein